MPPFCQRIFEYFIQDRWNPNLSSELWRFVTDPFSNQAVSIYSSIFPPSPLCFVLPLAPPPSLTHSLNFFFLCPLSLPVTHFAEVRVKFETPECLILANIRRGWDWRARINFIPWQKKKSTGASGRRTTSDGSRSSWQYITVRVKYYYTLLVFECMEDNREREKKKPAEITPRVIIAHHGWAAEQNDWIWLQWFHICMC